MVEDGVLERFGIERAYGLHLSSAHPAGQVGFREGAFYASSDSIEITIEGKGGHGAAPHLSIDPIYVAGAVRRRGAAGRLAPDRSDRAGGRDDRRDPRRHDPQRDPEPRAAARHGARVRRRTCARRWRSASSACCAASARASGATYAFEYFWRYPVTSNDAEQTRYVRALAERVVGRERVADVPKLMGAEDFSFFAERVPACFFTIGSNGGPDERVAAPPRAVRHRRAALRNRRAHDDRARARRAAARAVRDPCRGAGARRFWRRSTRVRRRLLAAAVQTRPVRALRWKKATVVVALAGEHRRRLHVVRTSSSATPS